MARHEHTRALMLGAPGPRAARMLWAWLESGGRAVEFWAPRTQGRSSWRRDARLGRLRPGWSLQRALRRHGVPLRRVEDPRRRPELVERARGLGASVLLCSSFPWVLPPELLRVFGPRALNFHPALLPMYRGAAPLLHLLLRGEVARYGGLTLHVMAPEVDAGDIVGQRPVPWPVRGGFERWGLELGRAVDALVRDELQRYLAGELPARPQAGSGCRAPLFRGPVYLDATLSAARMRGLAAAAHAHPLHVRTPQGSVRVARLLCELGAPTGAPPELRGTEVGLDAADRRVLFERWQRGGRRRARRARAWAALRVPPRAGRGASLG